MKLSFTPLSSLEQVWVGSSCLVKMLEDHRPHFLYFPLSQSCSCWFLVKRAMQMSLGICLALSLHAAAQSPLLHCDLKTGFCFSLLSGCGCLAESGKCQTLRLWWVLLGLNWISASLLHSHLFRPSFPFPSQICFHPPFHPQCPVSVSFC